MRNFSPSLTISIPTNLIRPIYKIILRWHFILLIFLLALISMYYFDYFFKNGLGLAYNDARSHLDIGRRVVEGLKPGLAQLGSVWLPLPHILMVPTVWNDFFWHSGLAGALESMISFVVTGAVIYLFLKELNVGLLGRIFGVLAFVANLNILYLQSIAMTELLLLATLTLGCYELLLWHKNDKILNLVKAAFWIMLATLVRYEGWFLIIWAVPLITIHTFRKKGYWATEGTLVLFTTLAALGIVLWFLWNQLIFKDALYFALGPFSAHEQQKQLANAGDLPTKGNLLFSTQIYMYALVYNSGAFTTILGLLGAVAIAFDKKISAAQKFAATALFSPIIFNILALFLGFSVLFIQGLSGNTWFNARYGIMMIPAIAIFAGFLVDRFKDFRLTIIGLFLFVTFFAFANNDAVTIDDARVGASQKNVSEVSGYLKNNATNQKGFILISAASHDAIIFSSGLPMKRFIHEGTGAYWEVGTTMPDRWARWVVMRTHDEADLTYKALKVLPNFFSQYNLVAKYPFADVYELKQELRVNLNTEPIFGKLK